MGCRTCSQEKDIKEMINTNTLESKNENEKIQIDEKDDNKIKLDTLNSEGFAIEQERNEEIFDYYNDIRTNPQNYLIESEKYGLKDLISSAIERKKTENLSILLKNPFLNLFFNNYVKKYPFSKEEILKNMENNEQVKGYKKWLYIADSNVDNPKESIWNLLKDNKEIALDEILYKKIDYFIVCSNKLKENNIIKNYFFYLRKEIS